MGHSVEIFPWNVNFATGIDIIDEQHKQLLHLINKLAAHATGSVDVDTLQSVLIELADYVEYHFRAEEKIMLSCFGADPSAKGHLQSHHEFEEKIRLAQQKMQDQSIQAVLDETLSFLVHWLALHILDSDIWMTKVVLAVQQGTAFEDAKRNADHEMSGSAKVLIETILAMYDDLTAKTLQLMQEIVERQKAEQRLQLAGKVIENTLESIFITDVDGLLVDANPSFCSIVGCSEDDVTGQNIRAIHPALSENSEIWHEVNAHGHWVGETHYKNRDGETISEWLNLSAIKNDDGVITNYVGVFSNVSQLMERQKDLHHIANHDALTGLPNRMLLTDRLAQEIKNNQRQKNTVLLVLFIDLDGFKAVNDTYGHDAGDEVLVQTAQRFCRCVRAADTVVRLGGDEFVILLPNLSCRDDCMPMLDRLLTALAEPVAFKQQALHVTLSIGVAVCPDDGTDVETLLLRADKAMYAAKQSGKNQYRFYGAAV